MIRLTLEDIFEIPGARIYNPDEFRSVSSVSINSRNIKKNSLFVAIKGEKFDGHNFIREVIKKGASAVMINEKKYRKFNTLELPVITVPDTTIGYGDVARTWRRKLDTKVIGITGSAGKTSTKEMISAILSSKYKINKTILNNNNHIGVPLTILSTNNKHDVLVLELGTNHFGEIDYTAKIAEPDYALITNIGHSHLEFLKNKRGVLKEKIALFDAAKEANGTLFINKDDSLLSNSNKKYNKRFTYSFSGKADVTGKLNGIDKTGKENIEINYKNIKIKGAFFYGEQTGQNLLASSAVAFRLGLNKTQILKGLKKYKNADKRLNVKNYKKSFTIIDDTYNANPESTKYALELLSKIGNGRKKIAILGDMFELGDDAPKLHKALAKVIKKNKIDEVLLIGSLMKNLNSELRKTKIRVKHFRTREELKKEIINREFSKSVMLVKGSRGMRMEDFVKIIEGKISG